MGTFHPGRNVWRIEHANRAAVLIDAAAFFRRRARGAARRRGAASSSSAGTSTAAPGWSARTARPMTAGRRRCAISSSALVRRAAASSRCTCWPWDYSPCSTRSSASRFPSLKLGWNTPPRVRFRLDNALPVGASHHQKIIVVDDAVAFSGGLDLTIRRWDTRRPRARRSAPASIRPGSPTARSTTCRWWSTARPRARSASSRASAGRAATGERDAAIAPHRRRLAGSVAPDFTDVEVGIARTLPVYGDQRGGARGRGAVPRHDRARPSTRSTSRTSSSPAPRWRSALARAHARAAGARSRDRRAAHARHLAREPHHAQRPHPLPAASSRRRASASACACVYPEVQRRRARRPHTMVHSKVMIVDDRLLRIGSANLNNRSMGTDTECDLAIEARSDGRARRDRAACATGCWRDHCGVPAAQAAAARRAHRLADRAPPTR